MKFSLKNIGIIDNASFDIEGLTVITGMNNSGKSTVGKALFSIISAIENINYFAFIDKKIFIADRITKIFSLNSYDIYFDFFDYEAKDTEEFPLLLEIYKDAQNIFADSTDINMLIEKIRYYMKEIDKLAANPNYDINMGFSDNVMSNLKGLVDGLPKADKLIIALEDVLKEIDAELHEMFSIEEYATRRIFRSIKKEFNGQIVSVKNPKGVGEIRLFDKEDIYFNIVLDNENILNKSVYKNPPMKEIYLIDDPYIVDNWKPKSNDVNAGRLFRSRRVRNEILYITEVPTHTQKIQSLINIENQNIFADIQNTKRNEKIFSRIDEVLPIDFVQEKDRFVDSKNKLDIRNLATGSKSFLIMKQLLLKGKINSNTIIVFDEPEVHLHPEWQNIFAELIVLLTSELKANILLTTHSTQFLLALETYSKKYNIKKKTHYYTSETIEGKNEFVEITKNTKNAYAKLSKSFLEMDAMSRKMNE